MGTLYYGDNLDILRRYIPDESVDLIYLDPPFNSAQNYNAFFEEKDGTAGARISPPSPAAVSASLRFRRSGYNYQALLRLPKKFLRNRLTAFKPLIPSTPEWMQPNDSGAEPGNCGDPQKTRISHRFRHEPVRFFFK